MHTIDTQPLIMLIGICGPCIDALAAWFIYKKKKQSRRLQERFGPAYGRSVNDLGSRTKAEEVYRCLPGPCAGNRDLNVNLPKHFFDDAEKIPSLKK